MDKEGITIDQQKLFRAYWKRAWLIILVAVLFGAATYAYSATMIAPTYRTSFTAYINNRMATDGGGNTSSSDLTASIRLSKLYSEVIRSRSVLQGAAEKCGRKISVAALRSMVSVDSSDDAAMITVNVTDGSPVGAVDLAKAIAEVAPVQVARIVDGSNMKILDEPQLPEGKVGPHNTKNAMIGACLGAVLVLVIITVVELSDRIVRGTDDLEQMYGIAVVGRIPSLSSGKSGDRYGYKKGDYGYKKNYYGYRKAGAEKK